MKYIHFAFASTLLFTNTPVSRAHQAFQEDDELIASGEEVGQASEQQSEVPTLNELGLEIPEAAKTTIKDKIIKFFSHEPSWYWEHYRRECCWLMGLLFMLWNFFKGKD